MKKIDQIIRRFKYLIHLFIALIGVILIIVADSYFSGTGDNITYDVLIGTGCSVIATAIITLLLLAVLPDNKEENTELATWGLKRIHDERRTATFPPDECPRNKLDYIAFGLKHFRSTTGYDSQLLRNIRRGLHVRILTLHPYSEFVKNKRNLKMLSV